MIKKFLIITLNCCLSGFSNPVLDLCHETKSFFSYEDDNQPSLDEAVSYVIDLRDQIEALGYEVPSMEELIYRLDEQLEVTGLSNQLYVSLNPIESLDGLSGHFCCCSGGIYDDFDLTNASIGVCELLAGGLLLILPYPGARICAGILLGAGYHHVMSDVAEVGRQNGQSTWGKFKEFIYD